MAIPRWNFKEHEGPPKHWTWTRKVLNGDAAVTSKEFRTYGEVVTNALNAGFQPTNEAWSVTTFFGTTVYQPHPSTPVSRPLGSARMESGERPKPHGQFRTRRERCDQSRVQGRSASLLDSRSRADIRSRDRLEPPHGWPALRGN